MNKPPSLSLIIALLGMFLTGVAQAKPVNSLEEVLKSAPSSALRKLFDNPNDAKSLAEVNQYFGRNVTGQRAVMVSEIEFAEYTPGGRQSFRARALSVPVKWKHYAAARLNYFYFPEANMPPKGTVRVGSRVKVSGVVRRCEIVNNGGKLQMNFDLTESKL
jgi:hypothetical protein